MPGLSRSMALRIAAVLSAAMGVSNIVFSLPLLAQGAQAIDVDARVGVDTPPFFVVVLALILGVVALVAAYGTWKQQRWGIILTIIVNAVGGLSAVPGLLFPTPFSALWWSALLGVLGSLAVVVLCLWRGRGPAGAQV